MTILENIKQLIWHLTDLSQVEEVEKMLLLHRIGLEMELYGKE